jgi:glycosyltransferase involved in cell wall biosynthesis
MLTLSHPTGNSNIRQVALALLEAGLLEEFWTCLNWNPQTAAASLLPSGLSRQLERRAFAPELRLVTRVHPWREIGRLLAPTLRMSRLTQHEIGPLSVDQIFHSLDRKVAARLRHLPRLRGVYAGEDGALETFRAAEKMGLRRFYDLPIAYWELGAKLLAEEAERWPQWEPTLVGTRDSAAKLARKTEELSLSEVIFVPSAFVRDSLPPAMMQSKTCFVAEFGSPPAPPLVASPDERDALINRPLRVLFAGSLTQRKGLADVFEAMRLLGRSDVELIVMGAPVVHLEFYQRLLDFRYETPRPQSEVFRLMRECDVLVLPSMVEGRALVQQEALSCGLPLIVTPNAGGEDLIVEGHTGFLVPIRCPEIIAEKIDWFASNRNYLPEMRVAARNKALQYTWLDYRHKIATSIKQVLA